MFAVSCTCTPGIIFYIAVCGVLCIDCCVTLRVLQFYGINVVHTVN